MFGDGEDNISVYDMMNKKLIRKEKFNKDSVTNIKISADLKYLAAGSLDGTVLIFDFETMKLLHQIEGSYSDILVIFT